MPWILALADASRNESNRREPRKCGEIAAPEGVAGYDVILAERGIVDIAMESEVTIPKHKCKRPTSLGDWAFVF
jgi:hypothetical protein